MAEVKTEAPTAVLDASALLAHLNDEDGAATVRTAMQAGAAISVASWVEVLSKLAERGEDPSMAAAEMKGAELIGQAASIEPITDNDSTCHRWSNRRSAARRLRQPSLSIGSEPK